MKVITPILSCGLLALGLAGTAIADDVSLDPLADSVLAGGCAGCHGTAGALEGLVPAIAGRPADELETLLLQFKNEDTQATVMNRIAAGYTDDELARLAVYFSAQ